MMTEKSRERRQKMNKKENFLKAISFNNPKYVPHSGEDLWHSFRFEGMINKDSWTDPWGIGWVADLEDTVPFPKKNPIDDITRAMEYAIPNPQNLHLSEETKKGLKNVNTHEKLIEGHFAYFVFERAWALMGMEAFLMAVVEYPDECHELLHRIAGYARAMFDRYLEIGIDAISFSEDLGTQRALLFSPEIFREFFLPEYQFAFENVKKEGKIINFHSCGCVEEIASDLADIGVTILNPIQAKANDLKKIKSITAGRMALLGGIDTATIYKGTPEDVRAEVIRVMEILKPGSGYICGPDQMLPGFPAENLDMLYKTVLEFGCY